MAAAAPLALYAGLAAAFFGTAGSWSSQCFGAGGAEAFAYVWFLNWWPFALAHHLNPLVTTFMWYPGGYNLTWAAAVPTAALLAAPITLTFGPVLAFNLLSLTAPALAAWTAFLLARYLTRDTPSAFIGGYLFGFSSYELGKLMGQLNLDMICLVPLAVLLCAARARQDIARLPFIAALALLLAAQLGLSTEIFLTLCLFGGMSWAIFLLFAAPSLRPALWRLAGEAIAAAAATVILAAPFFLALWAGLAETPAQFNSPLAFSIDLLNFIVPTQVTLLGHAAAAPLTARFSGALSEQGGYLGLPLILLLACYFGSARSSRALLAILGLLVLCSLGPALWIAGHDTRIPLPWALTGHLPVLRSLLPNRFSLYIALVSGIAVSLWLAAPAGRSARLGRYALALAACLFLLPNPANLPWTPLPAQPFFTAREVTATLGPMPNVLILPFGGGALAQVQAGMSFTQTGGYLGYVPRHEAMSEIIVQFVQGAPGADFGTLFPAFCAAHKLDAILIGPGTQPSFVAKIAALHWPRQEKDGLTIIRVPEESEK